MLHTTCCTAVSYTHLDVYKRQAAAIARLGIDVVTVDGIRESDHTFALLESGCIDYIVYTLSLIHI